MSDRLGGEWDPTATRGMAAVACSHQGWFQVMSLARAVRDAPGLGLRPRIAPLVGILDEHQRSLVALVDRGPLRVLHVELGEVTDEAGLTDVEPRSGDTDVELGSFEHRIEEAARAHFGRAAGRVEGPGDWPTGRLTVGGPTRSWPGW